MLKIAPARNINHCFTTSPLKPPIQNDFPAERQHTLCSFTLETRGGNISPPPQNNSFSRWWCSKIFVMFTPIWVRWSKLMQHIFVRWVETTNQFEDKNLEEQSHDLGICCGGVAWELLDLFANQWFSTPFSSVFFQIRNLWGLGVDLAGNRGQGIDVWT